MRIDIQKFGSLPNGEQTELYCFESENGLRICITNYGGIITSISMPDKHGNNDEICAGFPNLSGYLNDHPFFGVIVGRYANRIASGKFTINGIEYNLPINNGPNHLHGGNGGFHTKLWQGELSKENDKGVLKLFYQSPDMEEGYPGVLDTKITYTITDSNELHIEFSATTNKTTHVNLTSHGYFNLSGFKRNIFDHTLFLNADKYLEIDETQIPTGRLLECISTPFDFTSPQILEKHIIAIGGIDHCFVLNQNGINNPSAILSHPPSGRKVSVFCTHPGLQVYTGNWLDGNQIGHNGVKYTKHSSICLEMQHFPDSPNKPNFPSTLLNPGEIYYQKAKFVFELMKI